MLEGREDAADWMRRLREAALKDDKSTDTAAFCAAYDISTAGNFEGQNTCLSELPVLAE